jgi:hypothetical protein
MKRAIAALAVSLLPGFGVLFLRVVPLPLEWTHSRAEVEAGERLFQGLSMPDGGWPEMSDATGTPPFFTVGVALNLAAVMATWILGYGVIRKSRSGRTPGGTQAVVFSASAIVSASVLGAFCLFELVSVTHHY